MCLYFWTIVNTRTFLTRFYMAYYLIISRQALAREGDYEMMPVCACVPLVSHADFFKTTTATEFL